MNADLLRDWLDLTDANWPPEEHLLLGVVRGERDLARIEHQVQDRLAKLRCYQISHPEEATEGMNRLAQAFVHFMDCCPKPAAVCTPTCAPKPVESGETETPIERKTKLDWQDAPPPVRRSGSHPTLSASGKKQIPKAQPAPNAQANTQMILDLAQDSPEARAGLGTLDAVIRRAEETRLALVAWNNAGRWLRDPKRAVVSVADDQDLTRCLNALNRSLKTYPGIIGQPGKPGYRVAATARMKLNSLLVRGMDLTHRELLALDWFHGRKVLLAHRRFLLRHFRSLRKRGPYALAMHAVRAFVNDHSLACALSVVAIIGLTLWLSLRWMR